MTEKNLLTRIGETIDHYKAEQNQRRIELPERTEYQTTRHPLPLLRVARWLLPTPGNVIITVLIVFALFWAQSAGAFGLGQANVPNTSTGTIAYQGRLADNAGNPLTGTYPMVFRLYDAASGGAPLWEEQWTFSNSVAVSDGLFNVMLGSITPVSQSVINLGFNSLVQQTVARIPQKVCRNQGIFLDDD